MASVFSMRVGIFLAVDEELVEVLELNLNLLFPQL